MSILDRAKEVKKALAAAAGALVALQAYGGWSTEASDVIKNVIAVLAIFGVTYAAKNENA